MIPNVVVVVSSLLIFTSGVFGTAISKRDNGCDNAPNGVSDNSYPFSLWAQYGPGGAKVHLAMGTFDTTSTGVESVFLAPAHCAGVTVGNLFQLNNSGLIGIGYPDSNNQSTTWNSQSTDDGGPLPFSLSKNSTTAGIAEDYCELVSTDPNGSIYPGPVLSGEGTSDEWSICNRTDIPTQQGVVLKAASYSSDYGYNFSTCESVHVFLRSAAIVE